jgi:hypothetical protein
MQQARLGQHPYIGLLHQILGELGRAAQSPRGAAQPITMVAEPFGFEHAGGRPRDAGVAHGIRVSLTSLTSVRSAR